MHTSTTRNNDKTMESDLSLEFLRVVGTLRLVLFGALLTVCIIFVPGGLASLWRPRSTSRPAGGAGVRPAVVSPAGGGPDR